MGEKKNTKTPEVRGRKSNVAWTINQTIYKIKMVLKEIELKNNWTVILVNLELCSVL